MRITLAVLLNTASYAAPAPKQALQTPHPQQLSDDLHIVTTRAQLIDERQGRLQKDDPILKAALKAREEGRRRSIASRCWRYIRE